MLGRLHMTIDDAIEAYKKLSPGIFKKKVWTGSQASKYVGAELGQYWFEGKNIEDAVQELLQLNNLDRDLKLFESDRPDCRVYVCYAHLNTGHLQIKGS